MRNASNWNALYTYRRCIRGNLINKNPMRDLDPKVKAMSVTHQTCYGQKASHTSAFCTHLIPSSQKLQLSNTSLHISKI